MINKSDLLDYGIEYKGRWLEEIKTKCPKCSDKRRKKKEPCLAINTHTGLFTCHHCAWSGVIKKDKMDKIKYVRPKVLKTTPPPNKILQYFKSRGITEEVVKRNKITQCNIYMPQVQKNRDSICFNYYRDGELINIKYRDGDKNFKQVAGAEKIFGNNNKEKK